MSKPGKVVVPYVPQSELQGEIETGRRVKVLARLTLRVHSTLVCRYGYIHRAFGLLVDVPHVVPIFLSPSLTTHALTHSLHPLTPLILLILFQIGRDSNQLLWSQI